MPRHEIIIVGAGPIGIELAVALRKRNCDFAVLEAGPVGATMGWWAPGTKFFSSPERIAIAGVPLTTRDQEKATREEYLGYLRSIVREFDLPIRTGSRVLRAKHGADGFELEVARTSHGVGGPAELLGDGAIGTKTQQWHAKKLVLVIGDMHRPRMLGIEGEDLPHVSHFLDDPHQYFPGHVVIVGGKNSAIEAAIRCYRAGCRVTLSYRRAALDPDRIKYWLFPEIQWLIKKGFIDFVPSTRPVGIDQDGLILETRTSESAGAGRRRIEADHILLLTGYEQNPILFEQLGVELVGKSRKPRFNRDTMETSVPGVFVAGTATGGTQDRARVFIETSHVHVDRILAALEGRVFQGPTPIFELEEN